MSRASTSFGLSDEKQWHLHTAQPMGSVKTAVKAEASLGQSFESFRTEANNNEVYIGLDAMDVLAKLATMGG